MKKINIGIGLLMGLFFVNCSGFLDETPDNRTKIDSVDKIGEVVTLAYPRTTHFQFTDIMSDNAVDNGNITLENVTNTESFFWEDIRSESQDSPTNYWFAAYAAIAQANTAYDAALKLEGEFTEKGRTKELRRLKEFKGEALIARAYAHFMLVNLFGKTYNPLTASSDLGVPYSKEVETELLPKYSRNTVQEVYDFIEADLIEGLEMIKTLDRSSETKWFHFSLASARAFAAKFYIFKGEFEKSLEYSNDLALNGSTLRDLEYYSTLGDKTTVEYPRAGAIPNLLVGSVMSNIAYNSGNRYMYTSTVANDYLYSRDSNPFGKEWNYGGWGVPSTKLYFGIIKFPRTFEVTDPTNQTGFRYTNVVLFSNDMLYLDRIEALISANYLSDALAMMNTWVASRTKAPSPANKLTETMILNYRPTAKVDPFYMDKLSTNQVAYLEYLADLRRRDSYLEGQRWFDIKRFNIELTHRNIDGSARVEVLTKNDFRREIQLPQMAIANGLQANPR
ncbi:RagB/SusD family nutrient uptake outer membrane protein [Myroides odoratus]|uniref:RagB/SusD family nutrient uptake outer membrane protein n=1 Tax=Myroides odoratus TaxID=256 RepID=UPI0039AEE875